MARVDRHAPEVTAADIRGWHHGSCLNYSKCERACLYLKRVNGALKRAESNGGGVINGDLRPNLSRSAPITALPTVIGPVQGHAGKKQK